MNDNDDDERTHPSAKKWGETWGEPKVQKAATADAVVNELVAIGEQLDTANQRLFFIAVAAVIWIILTAFGLAFMVLGGLFSMIA